MTGPSGVSGGRYAARITITLAMSRRDLKRNNLSSRVTAPAALGGKVEKVAQVSLARMTAVCSKNSSGSTSLHDHHHQEMACYSNKIQTIIYLPFP